MLITFGLENNIYAQVAMVMLIGLLGKNAVLIVEFAVQKKQKKDFPQKKLLYKEHL
jgi:multidrug efflux pump subunit AcrB